MGQSTLIEDVAIEVEAPTSTGTSAVNGAVYDTAGYKSTLFIVRIGTAAANNSIKVQCGTDATVTDAADLAGTSVVSTTKTTLIVEVKNPPERYLRCVVTRGTSTTVNTIVCLRYGARVKSPAVSATGIRELHVGPIEGTA